PHNERKSPCNYRGLSGSCRKIGALCRNQPELVRGGLQLPPILLLLLIALLEEVPVGVARPRECRVPEHRLDLFGRVVPQLYEPACIEVPEAGQAVLRRGDTGGGLCGDEAALLDRRVKGDLPDAVAEDVVAGPGPLACIAVGPERIRDQIDQRG